MPNGHVDPMVRMSRLLALVAVKGLDNKDAVLTLTRAGYGQTEIATVLGIKVSAVSMTVLRHKEKTGRAKRPKRSSKLGAAEGADDGGGE